MKKPKRRVLAVDPADFDKAIAFYERAVGLVLGRWLFDGTAIELIGARIPVFLIAIESTGNSSNDESTLLAFIPDAAPVYLDFLVPDLEVAVQRAQAAGATLEGVWHTTIMGSYAALSDPFGHGLVFLQDTKSFAAPD